MRRFLFIVALGVLAWVFVVPSCSTKFGCESAPAVAQADSGDCPSDVEEAGSDAQWAADQLATIASKPETVGLFFDSDGTLHEFNSSHDEDEELATRVLREKGIVRDNATLYVASHVEVKAAAAMSDSDIDEGVLVINKVSGVCAGGKYSCAQVVPRVLPEGATLTVWSPKEIAAGQPLVFRKGG